MSFASKYLKTYNFISFIFWSHILLTTLRDVYTVLSPKAALEDKIRNIYVLGLYTRAFPHSVLTCVQVFCSTMEVLHSLVGLVRAPLGSALLQSFARLLITVGICYQVPSSPGNYNFVAFTAMSVAWSLTDMIRYFYYMRSSSLMLRWLRYSAFIVLYPIGLSCEPYIVYLTLSKVQGGYYYFLCACLLAYIPGFLYLYGYMWKQRGRILNSN